MTDKIILLHTCGVCGKEAQWDEGWEWYGSYKDLDNGAKVKKFCSKKCIDDGAKDLRRVKATSAKAIIKKYDAQVIPINQPTTN